jgi:hypothetical protein
MVKKIKIIWERNGITVLRKGLYRECGKREEQ